MRIERLEERCVLSAAPFIDAETGQLRIIGSGDNDIVEVSSPSGMVEVSIETDGVVNIHQFPRAEVKTVYFRGNNGDDTFRNLTTIRTLVYGNDGNDTLIGGVSGDEFHGGNGDDILEGNGGKDYLHGDSGDDTLRGGDGNDLLYGFKGDDRIEGGDGHDYISGFYGDDILIGGPGRDTMHGHNGNDFMDGGADRDFMYGHLGDDEVFGGDGDDYITTYLGNDTIYAGAGDDTVRSHEGDDFIDGGDGDDAIYAWMGDDTLIGGEGNDYLSGYHGEDTLIGGEGNDYLRGHEGNDILKGNGGNDRIFAWYGDDNVDGGDGDDTLSGYLGNDIIIGGAGDDVIKGHEGDDILSGGDGNDSIYGWKGNDTIDGGAGDDYLSGSYDDDVVRGGDGDDEVRGGEGADELFGGEGVDHLLGGNGNDFLDGGDGADMLCAGHGDDVLIGRGGDDIMNGMTGNDVVWYDDTLDAIAIDLTKQAALQNGGEEAVKMLEAVVGSLGDDLVEFANPAADATYNVDGTDGYDVISLLDYTKDDVELIDGGIIVTTASSAFTIMYVNVEKIELADCDNVLEPELAIIEEYIHTIFINDSNRNLASYNTESGVFTMIGQTSVVLTDIAVSREGRMFGTTFTGLYEIDPETAEMDLIASYNGVNSMNALAFLPDGTLVATGHATTDLFTVDLATAGLTSLGSVGVGSAGDLAFHEGELLMATTDGRLIAIDVSDVPVTSTTVGNISSLTYGLASQGDDDLYAGARSSLYALDDDSAATEAVENFRSQGIKTIYGMAAYNEVIPGLFN